MTISAKIIADSVSPQGIRLTTLQLRYPKFIHGEFMTHRMFSRNASSSRAIPVERLIEDIERDPVAPSSWGSNKPGMQAGAELSGNDLEEAKADWWRARGIAITAARRMANLGVHKQIVNRILEPYSHINVVVTATEWSNFFALRCHPDAQPEIRELAEKIGEARDSSIPAPLEPSQWHLPYVDHDDRIEVLKTFPRGQTHAYWQTLINISVARCARVSYTTHDGKKPDIARDMALYNQLVSAVPLHASPAEHQAKPDILVDTYNDQIRPMMATGKEWRNPWCHGNFKGWIQYRKTLAGECQ